MQLIWILTTLWSTCALITTSLALWWTCHTSNTAVIQLWTGAVQETHVGKWMFWSKECKDHTISEIFTQESTLRNIRCVRYNLNNIVISCFALSHDNALAFRGTRNTILIDMFIQCLGEENTAVSSQEIWCINKPGKPLTSLCLWTKYLTGVWCLNISQNVENIAWVPGNPRHKTGRKRSWRVKSINRKQNGEA